MSFILNVFRCGSGGRLSVGVSLPGKLPHPHTIFPPVKITYPTDSAIGKTIDLAYFRSILNPFPQQDKKRLADRAGSVLPEHT